VTVSLAIPLVLLAASLPLIAQLKTLDLDRAARRRTIATAIGATATRVLYSVLVVLAFAWLPLAWAVGALPTAALLAFLTAPLAMRLGDTVSHRSGAGLSGALREGVLLFASFGALLGIALLLPA